MRARLFYLVVVAAGCSDPTYFSEKRPLETQPAMMGGGYQADTDLYVLPVRRPTGPERQALQLEMQQKKLPMAVPWAGTRDFDIEIEWSIKNLDSMPAQVTFVMNGGNEFGDYAPQQYINPLLPAANQAPPPPLMGGTPITLQPNEVREGVFREDELKEAAIRLEAITRYPDPAGGVLGTPFEVMEHDPSDSNIGYQGIPPGDVTPAMVRYVMILASDSHVAADYTVRVRDYSNKLGRATDKNLYVSTAGTLAPPATPPGAMMGAMPAM